MQAAWWTTGGEPVQVLAEETLWGSCVATVAVPSTGRVERVAAAELRPLAQRDWPPDELAWRAASGLIQRAMADGEPVAVARGEVDPLPHQLTVLDRAMRTEPLRLLLADEVGLGKTVEAGLIITELKERGIVRRVLVVAPKGIQLQWVAEMTDRFGEEFVLVGAGGVPLDAGIDPWRVFDQVVCSLDAIKPLRTRRGWSPGQVAAHNERRARAVAEAGWDLVIIDEAHHVAGSSDDVARHQLGLRLAESAPRLLLLSATPHSGKSEPFARLLGLLDQRFQRGLPVLRDNVAPLVVRTEKRDAIDTSGWPLFRPRATSMHTVPYGKRAVERSLYDAVTDYVRHGYRRARAERRPAIGFLVLLMQRLVSSSTAAILAALERRLVAVTAEGEQFHLFSERASEWGELSGEDQQAVLADAQGSAWGDERAEVELLIDLARQSISTGIDTKAHYLLELLARIAREEGDPAAKVVVFTEFVPTQEMLLEVLSGAGISAVAVNGSMSVTERRHGQEQFRTGARVLVSTDAGGEGVNLQFAHVVVNYDLPWSPTRIEQRIGRVHRIGQTADVQAHNLMLESSVDARVLETLDRKLDVILRELGVDKSGDVLASVDPQVDDLYATAILDPDQLETIADSIGEQARKDVAETEPLRNTLGPSQRPSPNRKASGLPRWLAAANAARERLGADRPKPGAGLPEVLPTEPVPQIAGTTHGWWSMWETVTGSERSAFAMFLTDNGAFRPDLADRIWATLADGLAADATLVLDSETHERLRVIAADHGYRHPEGLPPSLVLRLAVRVTP